MRRVTGTSWCKRSNQTRMRTACGLVLHVSNREGQVHADGKRKPGRAGQLTLRGLRHKSRKVGNKVVIVVTTIMRSILIGQM